MWHVNWVCVVVPFIVFLPAIWRTELIMFLQAEEKITNDTYMEERGVRLAR